MCKTHKEAQEIHNEVISSDTVTVRDTSYMTRDTFIYKDKISYVTVQGKRDTVTVADTLKLLAMYKQIYNRLNALNIYSDTLRVDSSYVRIVDTVTDNHIAGRKYDVHWKLPKYSDKTTITTLIEAKKRNQLYIGGGLMATAQPSVSNVYLGLQLKTKTDFLVGATAGANKDGVLIYGVNAHWKIKLKK